MSTSLWFTIAVSCPGEPSVHRFVDGNGSRTDRSIALGKISRPDLAERFHLRDCLPRAHSRRQPAKHEQSAEIAPLTRHAGHRPERLPQFGVLEETESVWHHANDVHRRAVDGDRSADDAGIGRVSSFPDARSDHNHGRGAGAVFFGTKTTAKDWHFTQQVETTSRDMCPHQAIGSAPFVGDGDGSVDVGRHIGKATLCRSQRVKFGERQVAVAALRVTRTEHQYTLGCLDGQPTQADGVDDREERVVDGDAQPERENRGRGKSRRLPEATPGMANVPSKIVHPPERPRVTMRVVHERDAPHRAPRRQARLVWSQSAPAMLVFDQREMRRDLAGEFLVTTAGTNDVE